MDTTSKYAIDACSLIKLRNTFPKDIVPGAWDTINEYVNTGIIISSEEIYLELLAQDDDIADWAKAHRFAFLPLENDIQELAKNILEQFPNIVDFKKRKSSGDPFLIATAQAYSCAIVTEEIPKGNNSPTVKIPNVCMKLDIPCFNLFGMLRNENIKFVRSG